MNRKVIIGLILSLILVVPQILLAQEEICEWCYGDTPNPPGPVTAIELTSFSAERTAGAVILTWNTGSEVNNEGFNIYRAESLSGPFTRVNMSLIPTTGSIGGTSYRFTDTAIQEVVTYYYRLEDINTSGVATAHNTISVHSVVASGTEPLSASPSDSLVSTPSAVSPTTESNVPAIPDDRSVAAAQNTISVPPILASGTVQGTPSIEDSTVSPSPVDSFTLTPAAESDIHAEVTTSSFIDQPFANPLSIDHPSEEPSVHSTPTSSSSPGAVATSSTTITFAYSLEEPNGNRLSVAKESGAIISGKEVKTSFRSYGNDNGVILEWYSDEATYGFNIWRSEKEDGQYVQVNDDLISYMDAGEKHRERVSYVYIDKGVKKGKTYFYILMKMATYKGEAIYIGPVQATPQAIVRTTKLGQ